MTLELVDYLSTRNPYHFLPAFVQNGQIEIIFELIVNSRNRSAEVHKKLLELTVSWFEDYRNLEGDEAMKALRKAFVQHFDRTKSVKWIRLPA